MDILQDLFISLSNGDPFTLSVISAVIIVIVSLLYFTCRTSNTRRCVLLTGVCEAGKTVLFTRLMRQDVVTTYTSIKENSGIYKDSGKNGALSLVDIPGHERLRQEGIDRYKAKARATVFVVDSSTIQKEIKDVSQYLYTILTDKMLLHNKSALLIACNKHDLTLAKGAELIQTMLEKEITTLRLTQSAMLESTTGTSVNSVFIGKKGKNFEFKDLKIKVQFCECSARGNNDCQDADIKAVQDWLAAIA